MFLSSNGQGVPTVHHNTRPMEPSGRGVNMRLLYGNLNKNPLEKVTQFVYREQRYTSVPQYTLLKTKQQGSMQDIILTIQLVTTLAASSQEGAVDEYC